MPILLCRRLLLLFFVPLLAVFSIAASSPPPSASELSVGPHPSKLVILPGQPAPLDTSAGGRPGAAVTCNRVHIHGLSRLRNITKFGHSLKVRVSVAPGDGLFRAQNLELCFHRNASLGIGMCAPSQWQKLSKGSWARSVSPYGNAILDIRMPADLSRPVEVSTEEEFLFHRVVFLVLGAVMMAAARFLSESVVFYYSSAMAVGIILVILMVLFQGMRLLPTGRKSSLAIFMYSSLVGVATFLLSYMSGLLRSILVELGISEDMHNPVSGCLASGMLCTGWSLVWLLGCS